MKNELDQEGRRGLRDKMFPLSNEEINVAMPCSSEGANMNVSSSLGYGHPSQEFISFLEDTRKEISSDHQEVRNSLSVTPFGVLTLFETEQYLFFHSFSLKS